MVEIRWNFIDLCSVEVDKLKWKKNHKNNVKYTRNCHYNITVLTQTTTILLPHVVLFSWFFTF